MKALICEEPGKFKYQDIEKPVAKDKQVLIKIKRVGICGTDLHAFEGTQPYFNYPRILGHELSGEVVDTNGNIGITNGEPVTFIPYFPCQVCIACRSGKPNCCVNIRGVGVHIDGGMVEYLSVPAHAIVKGEGLSYDELALIEPLAIGAHAIRRANVQKDEHVLVIGAGPIGLGIMEFARISGGKVIAMDINDDRLAFCNKALKVKNTINPRTSNSVDLVKEMTNGDFVQVVIDATGNLNAINSGLDYLAHGGRYVLVGLQKEPISFSHPEFHKRETTLMSSRNATRQDFEHVVNSLRSGNINVKNYITHIVPFDMVKEEFPKWLDPKTGVIKAMIELD